MPAVITPNNIFFKEPYSSIVFLLIEFGSIGLTKNEITAALFKEHYSYVKKETHSKIDDVVEKLMKKGWFNRYEIKKINRKKNLSLKKEIMSYKAKKIRANLENMLNRLCRPSVNAVKVEKRKHKGKQEKFYIIREEVYMEWYRTRNKDALSFYPAKQIYNFRFEPINEIQNVVSMMIYGITNSIIDSFNEEEIKQFYNNIEQIEYGIEYIEELKFDVICRKWDNRLLKFIDKVNNSSIKKALSENDEKIWICIRDALFFNRPEDDYKINIKKGYDTCIVGHIKRVNKVTFYRSLGWIFPVPGYEKSNVRPPFIETINSIDLSRFIDGEKITGKSINTMKEEEEKKYLSAWSIGLFSKDYHLSKKDILSILDWSWDNRDLFYEFWPYPISISRYYDEDKAFENWRKSIQPALLKYQSRNKDKI